MSNIESHLPLRCIAFPCLLFLSLASFHLPQSRFPLHLPQSRFPLHLPQSRFPLHLRGVQHQHHHQAHDSPSDSPSPYDSSSPLPSALPLPSDPSSPSPAHSGQTRSRSQSRHARIPWLGASFGRLGLGSSQKCIQMM